MPEPSKSCLSIKKSATIPATGYPGMHKTGLPLIIPSAVGFPGLIPTPWTRSFPSHPITAGTKSRFPTEVPPLVIIISASRFDVIASLILSGNRSQYQAGEGCRPIFEYTWQTSIHSFHRLLHPPGFSYIWAQVPHQLE